MDNIIINLNKEYVLKEVAKKLDFFGNAIIKKNNKINDLSKEIRTLKKQILVLKKDKTHLARVYAKQIGVLRKKSVR